MGRARDVADAEQQVEDERWKCATCEAPAEDGRKYCLCCRMYWDDSRQVDLDAFLSSML